MGFPIWVRWHLYTESACWTLCPGRLNSCRASLFRIAQHPYQYRKSHCKGKITRKVIFPPHCRFSNLSIAARPQAPSHPVLHSGLIVNRVPPQPPTRCMSLMVVNLSENALCFRCRVHLRGMGELTPTSSYHRVDKNPPLHLHCEAKYSLVPHHRIWPFPNTWRLCET